MRTKYLVSSVFVYNFSFSNKNGKIHLMNLSLTCTHNLRLKTIKQNKNFTVAHFWLQI